MFRNKLNIFNEKTQGPWVGGESLGRSATCLFFLHKAHERGPLDLHGLPLSVIQRQHEVEEVGFAQVGRRLLLKMSPGQTHSTAATHIQKQPLTLQDTELNTLPYIHFFTIFELYYNNNCIRLLKWSLECTILPDLL